MPRKKAPETDIQKFTSEARSLLWRMDDGIAEDKKNYHKWEARIKELQQESGLEKKVAIVQASKDFSILLPLFRKHDISAYDLALDDKGEVGPTVSDKKLAEIVCEGKTLSRLEEIEWAAAAAGRFKRTREMPSTCPSDGAFLWFEQAMQESKHFLDKFMQMTCKNMDEAEQQRKASISGQRSIKEIEGMLELIEQKYVPPPEFKRPIKPDAEGNRK